MLLTKHEVYSIAGDLHSTSDVLHTPIIQLTGKLRNLKGSKDLDFFSHLFHCDGLMLCSTEWNTRLVVWNPCTGQRRKIKPRTRYRTEDKFALGYTTSSSSSSGRSYKIFKYRFYRNSQKLWVADCEIYELCSDSWRVLDSFTLDSDLFFNGMSLKGDTYWVASGPVREGTDFFLMKFDFTAERFVRLPLPFKSSSILDTKLLSVVRDEKLSVLHIDDVTDVMRIWVTNKIDDEDAKDFSWRSDLVLEVGSAKFNLSVENFLLDEENRVAVCCDKFTSDGDRTMVYLVGEDLCKQVYEDIRNASPVNWPLVLTYVPSLVSIH
ncbi:putative F-box/kelch-repeat protein [Raphanus sativus]|uniref:F-box/kelch-repeat protein At3g17540 n=1 Tax=Raphanus sativus TaxID=3726 RepID=A0A6J0MMB5_RAPSA|nr:putative F-box/kelch-repeat protein At3g17540 [Raphanus sativus]KAJ4905677.1 putative F-box/kelch-repeat protein [Raphanus sativus]